MRGINGRVSTRVNKKNGLFKGKNSSNSRTEYALDSVNVEGRACVERTCVTCAYKGIACALFEKLKSYTDRRIGLLTYAERSVFHSDNVRAVYYFNSV